MNKNQIKTESQFLLDLLKSILFLPIIIFQIIFTKKKSKELLKPIQHIHQFIWQAKTTATLISIIIITSIIGFLLPEHIINFLINRPTDLFTFHWHTIITSGFIHANIGHLLGNIIALLLFGRVVEKELKGKKILISYFAALIISGIISSIGNYFILGNNTPGLGASGAIMGIVALAMLIKPLQFTYLLIIPLPISIVGWLFIIADFTGLLNPNDGIGHLAHLGGYLSIIIITYFFTKRKRKQFKQGLYISLATLIILGTIRILFL